MTMSTSISFDLEKARCAVCGQTIFRFTEREKWKHAISNNAWEWKETLSNGHWATPEEQR